MWVRKGTLKLNPPWETKPTQRKLHCLGKLLGSDWTTPRTKSKWSCALEVYWRTWILRRGAVPEFHFLLLGREGEYFQFKIGGEHFFINEVCPQEKILHQMSDLSPCLFYVAVKITMTKANCREEGLFFFYRIWFIIEKSQKKNLQQRLLEMEQKQRPLGEAVSLLGFKTHVQLLFLCIPIKPASGWHCPQLPKSSTIILQSRKYPTDLPTGKSDTGHPSAEAPSSQVYQQNN